MNLRNTFLLSILLLLIYVIPASAWDCVEVHPTINLLAFENFQARLKAGHYGDRFDNCAIDDVIRYQGLTFGKAVKFEKVANARLVDANHTFSGWLGRGGFDADMPQISMGLRHFYDPIYEPRYLTWQHRSFSPGKKSSYASEQDFFKSLQYFADDWNPNFEAGVKNRKMRLQPKKLRPQMDAVTWAFEHEENDYCWTQGKIAYKAAMENDTTLFGKFNRSQMFGKAFRALGETMHLMADMTQPAHTRGDSHAVYEPIEMTVDEKMVRKVMGNRHKDPKFRPVPEFEIEETMEMPELMKRVSAFTNHHFFSNDTIFDYATWKFPRNKKRPYSSPQLSRLKHDAGIYYGYFETVGLVPLAKETGSPFSKVLIDNDRHGRKNPYYNVTPAMAESQAKVLIPLAVYNCAECIKAFLPSFKVSFTLQKTGTNDYLTRGELIHNVSRDDDWYRIGAIRFNGPGHLRINDSWQKVEIRNGCLVETRLKLKSGDKVTLVIRAGGLIIASQRISIP